MIGTTARWLVPPLLGHLERALPRGDRRRARRHHQLAGAPPGLAAPSTWPWSTCPSTTPSSPSSRSSTRTACSSCPPATRCTTAEVVTLDELAEHELLLEAPGTAFRDVARRDTRPSRGSRLRPKAEVDGMRLLASLAFAGFGAGIVPASAAPAGVAGDLAAHPHRGGVGPLRRSRPSPRGLLVRRPAGRRRRDHPGRRRRGGRTTSGRLPRRRSGPACERTTNSHDDPGGVGSSGS